jgi:hypothetical protein
MHMQDAILAKVISQVLPHRHHPLKLPSINHRSIRKPSLRPIDTHSPAAKRGHMALRPSMDLISFRHKHPSSFRNEVVPNPYDQCCQSKDAK